MKRVSSADLRADPAAVIEMSKTESVQIVSEDGSDGIIIHCRRPLLGTICDGCGTYHEEGCELVAEILRLKQQLAWTATYLRREHASCCNSAPDCSVCILLKAVDS